MFGRFLTRIFGSRNERVLRRLRRTVEQINALETEIEKLPDADFPAQTAQLRDRLRSGESVEALLPRAFALVREAGRRRVNMRHFDVQLIGGMVLHQGNIAEMRTGEGKTLVATLAAYLNALAGEGVHIVTVNDYLARRDAEWMGAVYRFLGLSTGVIVSGLNREQRRAAYAADVTYGTNNEFGFDYLRDNMVFRAVDRVQRRLNYAIVDEVDSILIDEARTPLIISGPVDDRSDLYISMNRLVPQLRKQKSEEDQGDFSIDEKSRQAYLSEQGHERVEKLLVQSGVLTAGKSLYDPINIPVLHHLNAALRAHALYQRDVDYIIKDGEVVIVDEFTGRTMPGRRWSEGLHQAIEAKEGVAIQNENQTLATITYQNYFRLYRKLSGMTGTADTEAFEFQQIYGLEVLVIPTHMTMIRSDQADVIFLTAKEKFRAINEDIKVCVARGQPVLVGTVSIEISEFLSGLLQKEKIRHQVLNAKFHEQEAEIIAQAGRPGTVTIATNMAGRGTDIVLGGNFEAELRKIAEPDAEMRARVAAEWRARHEAVIASGGLRIVGTERHESRRIDNQLRGRSGRQGDPGSSRFYLSLEDNLMRIFASERVAALMQRLGMEEGEAIESNMVTRAIENAQRKVEAHNFDIRKHLLEYDDVANDQRKVVYEWRNDLLAASDIAADVVEMRAAVVNEVFSRFLPPDSMEEMWDIPGLVDALDHQFGVRPDVALWVKQEPDLQIEQMRDRVLEIVRKETAERLSAVPGDLMRKLEKDLLLDVLDRHWKEHLVAMDHLRQGIGLRSYAAKNPKQEYKREAFSMFSQMLENIKHDFVSLLAKIQIRAEQDVAAMERRPGPDRMQTSHPEAPSALKPAQSPPGPAAGPAVPFIRRDRKIGRNDPCPCGSGKKYKQCHGLLA
ncbi:MAG: preprotein translocase subunit SecA [Gammaproteobacteria bacterium]|nr:preprotein translocase subunit SecA [Gammaproteobacteria bacterium]